MDKQTGSNSSRQGTSESRDISLGCGSSPASSAAATSVSSSAVGTAPSPQTPPPITLNINTTTGGNFTVLVDASNSVENLKKVIAKKLKVAKDRICLLHREKELQDGTLKENGLMDGSKIILIPNVETGLLAQRPENTVMQALESLNDSQVNDFLSGKTPLNLSMRLGDHMMLIQLQLSTVNPVNIAAHSSSRTRSTQRGSRSSSAAAGTSQSGQNHHSHHYHHHHHHTNSTTSANAAPVASTSASAQRKHDSDAANPGSNSTHNSHRQRVASVSAVPSLRVPAAAVNNLRSSDLSSFLSKRDYESLQNIVRSIAMAQPIKMAPLATRATQATADSKQSIATASSATTCCSKSLGSAVANAAPSGFHSSEPAILEQSPIKSLSNLVSSPIKTTAIKNIPIESDVSSGSGATAADGSSAEATCQDPISAKLTSCLCTRLNGANGASMSNGSLKSCVESTCQSRQDSSDAGITESPAAMLTSTPSTITSSAAIAAAASSSSSLLLHKTANNPIVRSKHRHHHHHHHHHHHYHHHGSNGSTAGSSTRKVSGSPRSSTSILSTSTNDSGFVSESDISTGAAASTSVQSAAPTTATSVTAVELDDSGVTLTDTRTLAEASRNLTQTLRKLSKEVFTNKIDISSEDTPRKSSSGAVIESMKNHGKGIYSGTFSGTLNPALQDRYGRPKRDISTVIHILNDLLSATPQYSRGAHISFEAPSRSGASTSSSGHTSRSKQYGSKHHHHSYAQSVDTCAKCISRSQSQSATSHSGSSSSGCAYGECNGHYTAAVNKQTKHAGPYICCQDLSTASASHRHHQTAADASGPKERNMCSCRYVLNSETGERVRDNEHMCQKCLVEMENNKTKSKLDQLRLVMQQRKQKREARKLKGAPYGARVVGATTEVTSTEAGATVTATCTGTGGQVGTSSNSTAPPLATTPLATASPSEVSPNHIVEEVDTAA